MATKTEDATTTTAECGDSATKVEPQPEATRLTMFAAPRTPAETFARTAEYAKDAKSYLINQLGQEVFDQRRDFLCVPDTITKDVYGTGEHKIGFEKHIAKLLGKSSGLFFITGVQAQLSALKVHCERVGNPRLAWHVSCHIESAEARSFEKLYGLERILLGSDASKLPTVDEIKGVLALPEDERPAAVVLEIPNRELGCETYSFGQLCAISEACRAASVLLHCDGARIWEIEPYYQATAGKTFEDIGQLFDSVYVSFYKGLGGISGAMLLSNDDTFISDARMWQRRAGGNPFTLGYEVIDCERGFNETIGTFARKREKMIELVKQIKEATNEFHGPAGQPIVQFVPPEATCCQIRTIFDGFSLDALLAARDRVQEKINVRVLERAWPKVSLDDKMATERAGVTEGDSSATKDKVDERHLIEWMIMSVTEKIPTQTFVEAYVCLCKELIGGK